jgi:hypothetical protein
VNVMRIFTVTRRPGLGRRTGLTASRTVPRAAAVRVVRRTRRPDRTSLPGPGTATGTTAEPLRLRRLGAPMPKALDGRASTAGGEPGSGLAGPGA